MNCENSSKFSNLNGFSLVWTLFIVGECFTLHLLLFMSFKKFWEKKNDHEIII